MLILKGMRRGSRRLKRDSLFKPNISCEHLIMRGGKSSATIILEGELDIFASTDVEMVGNFIENDEVERAQDELQNGKFSKLTAR